MRGDGAAAAAESAFPAGGLYWSVVGDPAYGEAQPPLSFATAQQYAAQWDVCVHSPCHTRVAVLTLL